MHTLNGKVALITGANRGIGQAIAAQYARAGCRLVLVARGAQELEQVAHTLQRTYDTPVIACPGDISNDTDVHTITQTSLERFGQIDILVNNAGILGPVGPLWEVDSQAWAQTLAINLGGTVSFLKHVVPHMIRRGYGRIINVSGGGALMPAPFFDAYSVTKASVVRLTENLDLEFKEKGIHNILVFALAPSGVNTRMFENMLAAGQDNLSEKIWEELQKRQEAGGDPMDAPAGLALYLASEAGAALSGRVISAKWDPWATLAEHQDEIAASDLYTMRRIMPKDRGYRWE